MDGYPEYESGVAYLTARITKAETNATVVVDNAMSLLDFLESKTVALKSYFISYDGMMPERKLENSTSRDVLLFSVYWHGRKNVDAEKLMKQIVTQIKAEKTIEIHDQKYTVSFVGGRHLLIDKGFNSYQLDIEMKG